VDGRVGVGGTDDLRGAEGEQDTPTLAHDRAIRGAVVKAGRLELGLAIRFGFGSVLFLVSFPFVLKSLFVFVFVFKNARSSAGRGPALPPLWCRRPWTGSLHTRTHARKTIRFMHDSLISESP
jgi:hypothetical protein